MQTIINLPNPVISQQAPQRLGKLITAEGILHKFQGKEYARFGDRGTYYRVMTQSGAFAMTSSFAIWNDLNRLEFPLTGKLSQYGIKVRIEAETEILCLVGNPYGWIRHIEIL